MSTKDQIELLKAQIELLKLMKPEAELERSDLYQAGSRMSELYYNALAAATGITERVISEHYIKPGVNALPPELFENNSMDDLFIQPEDGFEAICYHKGVYGVARYIEEIGEWEVSLSTGCEFTKEDPGRLHPFPHPDSMWQKK